MVRLITGIFAFLCVGIVLSEIVNDADLFAFEINKFLLGIVASGLFLISETMLKESKILHYFKYDNAKTNKLLHCRQI